MSGVTLCENFVRTYAASTALGMRSLALFTMPLAYIGSCEKDRHIDIPGRFAVNDTLVSAVFLAGFFDSVPDVIWSSIYAVFLRFAEFLASALIPWIETAIWMSCG